MVIKKYSPNIRHYISDKKLLIKRWEEIIYTSSKVFLKKGFDRTGLDEIAEAVGMTKGGLYRYIGSKDDILHLILEYTQEITGSFLSKTNH
jgi:AcrR family transcriptional regulator